MASAGATFTNGFFVLIFSQVISTAAG